MKFQPAIPAKRVDVIFIRSESSIGELALGLELRTVQLPSEEMAQEMTFSLWPVRTRYGCHGSHWNQSAKARAAAIVVSTSVSSENLIRKNRKRLRAGRLHICAGGSSTMWITLQQYTRVVGSLTEGRCAGENAEDLAIDYRLIANTENGSVLETVALLHASLDSIRQAVTAPIFLGPKK